MADENRTYRIPEVHTGAGTSRGGHIGSNTPSAAQLAEMAMLKNQPALDPSHELTYSPTPELTDQRERSNLPYLFASGIAALGIAYAIRRFRADKNR